ncbi:unnamed protein product [Amoebophrya sp. A120]|nr:unnamed protein product [Amoebophrya sp. A120]|eukprot:GSA120T00018057001.1
MSYDRAESPPPVQNMSTSTDCALGGAENGEIESESRSLTTDIHGAVEARSLLTSFDGLENLGPQAVPCVSCGRPSLAFTFPTLDSSDPASEQNAHGFSKDYARRLFLHFLRNHYKYNDASTFVALRGCGRCDRRHIRVSNVAAWAAKHLRGKQLARRFGSTWWKSFVAEVVSPLEVEERPGRGFQDDKVGDATSTTREQVEDALDSPISSCTTTASSYNYGNKTCKSTFEDRNYRLYAKYWLARENFSHTFDEWRNKFARSAVIGEITPEQAAYLTQRLSNAKSPPDQELLGRGNSRCSATSSTRTSTTTTTTTRIPTSSASWSTDGSYIRSGEGPAVEIMENDHKEQDGPSQWSPRPASKDRIIGRGFLVLRHTALLEELYAVIVCDFLGEDDVHVAYFWFNPEQSVGGSRVPVRTGPTCSGAGISSKPEGGLLNAASGVIVPSDLRPSVVPSELSEKDLQSGRSGSKSVRSVVDFLYYRIFQMAFLLEYRHVWMGPIDPRNKRYRYKFSRLRNCGEVLCPDTVWRPLRDCSEIDLSRTEGAVTWTSTKSNASPTVGDECVVPTAL